MFQTVLVALLTVAVLIVVLGAVYREPSPGPRPAGPTDPFKADFPRRWRGYDPVAVERRLAALQLAWAQQGTHSEGVETIRGRTTHAPVAGRDEGADEDRDEDLLKSEGNS
ncbi:MAG: hypothetical protein ACR2MA_08245 [Egibacteraceae bacterium]